MTFASEVSSNTLFEFRNKGILELSELGNLQLLVERQQKSIDCEACPVNSSINCFPDTNRMSLLKMEI